MSTWLQTVVAICVLVFAHELQFTNFQGSY